jgi:hypothetical protein
MQQMFPTQLLYLMHQTLYSNLSFCKTWETYNALSLAFKKRQGLMIGTLKKIFLIGSSFPSGLLWLPLQLLNLFILLQKSGIELQ